jgi:hypothetical protein
LTLWREVLPRAATAAIGNMWAWWVTTIGGSRQNFFHRCTAKVFTGIGELHANFFTRKCTFNKDHFAARETGKCVATGNKLLSCYFHTSIVGRNR